MYLRLFSCLSGFLQFPTDNSYTSLFHEFKSKLCMIPKTMEYTNRYMSETVGVDYGCGVTLNGIVTISVTRVSPFPVMFQTQRWLQFTIKSVLFFSSGPLYKCFSAVFLVVFQASFAPVGSPLNASYLPVFL